MAYETLRCWHCNRCMTKLYIHVHQKQIPMTWVPVTWYCVHCQRVTKRIDVYNKYKDQIESQKHKGKLHGRMNDIKAKVPFYCNTPMVKLYRNSNRKNEKGWIPEYWFCVKCDKVVSKIKKE